MDALKDALSAPSGVDCLVISGSDEYQDPWQDKSGSLTVLHWEAFDEREARYRGTKFVPDVDESPGGDSSLGEFLERDERAVRIWPK